MISSKLRGVKFISANTDAQALLSHLLRRDRAWLFAWSDAPVEAHDRSSLRILGSVGEPINPEAWRWYYDVVGERRCAIVDTWWQTETGGIMIANLAAAEIRPGSMGRPLPGVEAAILLRDEHGGIVVTDGKAASGKLGAIYSLCESIATVNQRIYKGSIAAMMLPQFMEFNLTTASGKYVQIAKLLGVPLVFTGHSLGRVKRQRLLASGITQEVIDARYDMNRRIDAEEETLGAEYQEEEIPEGYRAEGIDIGLRVLIGSREACVSASDTRPETIAEMAERAVAMAREAPEDPTIGLADPAQLARGQQFLLSAQALFLRQLLRCF